MGRSRASLLQLIKVHNNVTVHKSVAIMTHDMVNGFLKKARPDVDYETAQNLVTNNVFDSLSLITVVNLLEEEFSCKIPFQKVNPENFNSADSMTAMILSLGGGESTDKAESSVVSKEEVLGEVIGFDDAETYKPIVQRMKRVICIMSAEKTMSSISADIR